MKQHCSRVAKKISTAKRCVLYVGIRATRLTCAASAPCNARRALLLLFVVVSYLPAGFFCLFLWLVCSVIISVVLALNSQPHVLN